jgi:hypothetical protein
VKRRQTADRPTAPHKGGSTPSEPARSLRLRQGAIETWHEEFEYVIVKGETPRVAGFEFLATLEHEEGGTIIRRMPRFGEDAEKGDGIDLSAYREACPRCDHCGLERHRKDTYLVRNAETAEIKQVAGRASRTSRTRTSRGGRLLTGERRIHASFTSSGYCWPDRTRKGE